MSYKIFISDHGVKKINILENSYEINSTDKIRLLILDILEDKIMLEPSDKKAVLAELRGLL